MTGRAWRIGRVKGGASVGAGMPAPPFIASLALLLRARPRRRPRFPSPYAHALVHFALARSPQACSLPFTAPSLHSQITRQRLYGRSHHDSFTVRLSQLAGGVRFISPARRRNDIHHHQPVHHAAPRRLPKGGASSPFSRPQAKAR